MNSDFTNKKLIIFDFDGTLVDFTINYMSMRSEIIEFLYSSFEFPQNFFSINDSILITINKAQNYILHIDPECNWRLISVNVDKIMRKWEWKAAKKNQINSDVKETLEKIKKKGFQIAIFTLEPREIIEFLIKKGDIEHFIDLIASRDEVKNLKPNPEHLNYVLKNLKVKSDQVIVVGDHKMDMECGKSVKALCIGKKSNLNKDEELLAGGADYLISKISDLNSLMKL